MTAEGKGKVAILDHDRQQFEQLIVRALRSKGNVLTLAKCANRLRLSTVERRAQQLVPGDGVVTDIERGRALWSLLREAIDRLRPADSTPESTPAWRLYTIVHGIYVQGKSAKEMEAELDISPRTFQRARRAAVEALATVVGQVEEQVCSRERSGTDYERQDQGSTDYQ